MIFTTAISGPIPASSSSRKPEKLDYPQLKTAIHDYTRDTIARFKQAGVLPDMVQIGNEINGGILWPEELGSGAARVRPAGWPAERGYRWPEGEPAPGEQVKIMLHLAEGTGTIPSAGGLMRIDKRHVPYDVIGLSMYTYWNGPISALKANMDDISKRYNKDVIVVEAAYAYTPPTAITRKIVSSKRMGDIPPAYRGNITIFTI